MAVVGIDYGTRRIGVAVSESELIASPHSVIENREGIVETIVAIGQQFDASTFVLGIPSRSTPTEAQTRIRQFAETLRQRSCKEVVLWDESYSTTEAASLAREAGKTRRQERGEIDMHAATVILQSYLDQRGRRKP